MYKGKFDQKNKRTSSDVQELLAQRASTATKEAPAGKSPSRKAVPVKEPVSKAAPAKKVVKEAPEKVQKKGPRLGGVIFYTIYFLFILIFFVATYFGLLWLHGWLSDYEAAQPTVKSQQVFDEVFSNPDWEALYESSGAQDSLYEGKEAFVEYMTAKVGDSKLTYMETSAGLSGDKKYVVRLGDEKIASFTLVDRNAVGAASLENIGELPDWHLGAVEVFFEREESYLIQNMDGHTVFVNDVPLTDDHTIQIATTIAQDYLPVGTTGASICTQQVTGLMSLPTVTIFDEDGKQMEVTYDEETRTFTERTELNTITPEQEKVALEAAETYCKWMIEEVTNRGTLAKYFDTSADPYNTIIRLGELWMQGHNGYVFEDEKVTDYCRYSDDLFSVRVSLNLKVTRKDGSAKDYGFNQSLFFTQKNGKWLVFQMTNKDVSQPVGKVRLTFMLGNEKITSDFFHTDATEIITPMLPKQEGKVLTGWVTISEDENGNTVYTLVFQPDENNRVLIPEGTVLKPMTLYALYQDIDEAAQNSTEGA